MLRTEPMICVASFLLEMTPKPPGNRKWHCCLPGKHQRNLPILARLLHSREHVIKPCVSAIKESKNRARHGNLRRANICMRVACLRRALNCVPNYAHRARSWFMVYNPRHVGSRGFIVSKCASTCAHTQCTRSELQARVERWVGMTLRR